MSEGRNINNGRAIQLRSFFILLILRCELRYLDYWEFFKIPKNEIQIAKDRRKDFIERVMRNENI